MSTFIAGRDAFGSMFAWSSVGSTGTFTEMAGVLSIVHPGFSRGTVDVTNHGTTDKYEQHIAGGPIRSGNVGISAVYLTSNSQQTSLIPEIFEAGTRCGFKITVAGTSSENCWYGDGFITAYNPATFSGLEGLVGFSMSMKVSGKPILADSTT
jgi:predicted secreted protein